MGQTEEGSRLVAPISTISGLEVKPSLTEAIKVGPCCNFFYLYKWVTKIPDQGDLKLRISGQSRDNLPDPGVKSLSVSDLANFGRSSGAQPLEFSP